MLSDEEGALTEEQRALQTAVLAAIDEENLEALERLIPQLPEGVNTKIQRRTLLSYAAYKIKRDSVVFLLGAGARLEEHHRRYTALFDAAEAGQHEILALLLTHGGNVTGEFNFNGETPFSIAGFKLCEAVARFARNHPDIVAKIPDNMIFKPSSEEIEQKLLAWQAFVDPSSQIAELTRRRQCSGHLLGPRWIRFAEWSEMNPTFVRMSNLLFCLREAAWGKPDLFHQLDTAWNYMVSYNLLWDKLLVLVERPPCRMSLLNQDDMSFLTRAFREGPPEAEPPAPPQMVYQIKTLLPPSVQAPRVIPKRDLQRQVAAVNTVLKTKGSWDGIEENKLWVANFRGIHYYTHFFNEHQRADHQQTWHLNRYTLAPAAYSRMDLHPGSYQMTRETEAAAASADVREAFSGFFDEGGSVTRRGREFESTGAALQDRASNDYAGYQGDIQQASQPETATLKEENMTKYPSVASSAMPIHALRYAYGAKTVKSLQENRLRPNYDADGKPENPILGKIFISLMTPKALAEHESRDVAGMHNQGKIDVRDAVIWEREVGVFGGIKSGHLFYEACMEMADFSEPFSDEIQTKFGLNQWQFNGFRTRLSQGNARTRPQLVEKEMMPMLIDYQSKRLLEIARDEAHRRGGYLIYRHDDKRYGLELPLLRMSDGLRVPSEKEKALMQRVTETQFLRRGSSVATAPARSAASGKQRSGASYFKPAIAKRKPQPEAPGSAPTPKKEKPAKVPQPTSAFHSQKPAAVKRKPPRDDEPGSAGPSNRGKRAAQ